MGIEGLLHVGRSQLRNPRTALGLGVPAQEPVAASGGFHQKLRGQIAVVTMHSSVGNAAVPVQHYIGIVGRFPVGVASVEVHIRLDKPPLDQAHVGLLAGIGPEGHGIDKFIAGLALDDSLAEISVAVDPGAAAVVCKEHQGIELVLGQDNVVALNKIVHRQLHPRQVGPQQHIRLFLGNPIGIVRGIAAGAVTDGVLTVVQHRFLQEAFHILKDINTGFTGDHILHSFRGGDCAGCQSKKKHSRKYHTQYSLSHRHTYSFTIISVYRIIAASVIFCKPFCKDNYIL